MHLFSFFFLLINLLQALIYTAKVFKNPRKAAVVGAAVARVWPITANLHHSLLCWESTSPEIEVKEVPPKGVLSSWSADAKKKKGGGDFL